MPVPKKEHTVGVRLTARKKQVYQELAEKAEMRLSEWLRWAAEKAAKQALRGDAA